jgi:hypothetical protein
MAALSSQTADIADDPMGTQTASIDTPFQVTYLEVLNPYQAQLSK